MYNPATKRNSNGVGPVGSPQFTQNVLDVAVNGSLGNIEVRGDLFVFKARRHQPEDFHFAAGNPWSRKALGHACADLHRQTAPSAMNFANGSDEHLADDILEQEPSGAALERAVDILSAAGRTENNYMAVT